MTMGAKDIAVVAMVLSAGFLIAVHAWIDLDIRVKRRAAVREAIMQEEG